MARITLGDRLTALAADNNLSARDRKFAGDLLAYYVKQKSLTSGRRVWVDRLEARAAEEAARLVTVGTIEVPAEFVTLRERILATEGIASWSFNFVDSVIDQTKRGRTLSEKQKNILDNIKDQFSPAWSEEYKSTYREQAQQVAAYYRRAGLPYWQEMVGSILDNEEYVPRRDPFFKMFNNRYAQRVLEQQTATPAFTARASVQLRNNQTTRAKYRNYIGKKAFILAVGGVVEAVKGGRVYTVLFAGNPRPVEVQERYLMKAR